MNQSIARSCAICFCLLLLMNMACAANLMVENNSSHLYIVSIQNASKLKSWGIAQSSALENIPANTPANTTVNSVDLNFFQGSVPTGQSEAVVTITGSGAASLPSATLFVTITGLPHMSDGGGSVGDYKLQNNQLFPQIRLHYAFQRNPHGGYNNQTMQTYVICIPNSKGEYGNVCANSNEFGLDDAWITCPHDTGSGYHYGSCIANIQLGS